ncbi:MAG: hypothetical protein Q9165_005506 [Trypethelium subeluteriae]
MAMNMISSRHLILAPRLKFADFKDSTDEVAKWIVEPATPAAVQQTVDDLDAYIAAEGPFDAVMGFSQGAKMAATYIVHKIRQDPQQQRMQPTFKCAVFFSGSPPLDLVALQQGSARTMDSEIDGEVIHIPTVHFWGATESDDPTCGPTLNYLCNAKMRHTIIHAGGHEVPGPKDKTSFVAGVEAIRQAIGQALLQR